VAWHRTRELGFTGSFHDSARYVELLADFIGIFDDMTDEPGHPALHPAPAVGYPEGQSLAQHLRRAGSRGLIYPSVRAPAPGGKCLVCFEPHAIQNVRPGASWDLVWGSEEMKPANDNSAEVTNLKPCDHQAFFEAVDFPASPTDVLRAAFRRRGSFLLIGAPRP
jgi:hypothetical protein